jgi:hypothetical protein
MRMIFSDKKTIFVREKLKINYTQMKRVSILRDEFHLTVKNQIINR